MDIHSESSNRYKNRNNSWNIFPNNSRYPNENTSTDYSFFREPSEKRKKRIENHHSCLIEVYKRWYNYHLPLIDLDTFNQEYLTLEQIGPNELLREYALSHLKYYKADKKYKCISKLYDKFNKQVKEFRDENREHLRKLLELGIDDEYNLNILMRRYLYKITRHYKIKEPLDNFIDIEYEKDENPIFHKLTLINPFPSKTQDIIKDIKSRYGKIIQQIKELEKIKQQIEMELEDFKDLLKPIIIDENLSTKSECDFERKLSWINRFKSRLHLSN